MTKSMKQRLTDGETLLGLAVMYPAAGIIEGMCSGWDWTWIDGQHGQHDYRTILDSVRAAELCGLPAVVRVPGHDYGTIGPVMDMAPGGIMVPMVDTAVQARAVIDAVRFPPVGKRSYGGRRVVDRGGREYYSSEGDNCCLIAQVETLEAVDNAAEIAALEGIDVMFFGPDDMKVRMGLPINTTIDDSPELQQAMAQTARAAKNAGKVAGCVAATPKSIRVAVDLGYQLIVGGGDIVFLRVSAAERLASLKAALDNRSLDGGKNTQGGAY